MFKLYKYWYWYVTDCLPANLERYCCSRAQPNNQVINQVTNQVIDGLLHHLRCCLERWFAQGRSLPITKSVVHVFTTMTICWCHWCCLEAVFRSRAPSVNTVQQRTSSPSNTGVTWCCLCVGCVSVNMWIICCSCDWLQHMPCHQAAHYQNMQYHIMQ